MQYAVGEGQCTFLYSYDTIYSWDVENTWLISLIWISGHRQMKGIQISNTRTHGKHFGLRTDKTHHGWQQRSAAEAPCIVKFNVFACNWKLTKHVKDGQLEKVMQLFQQMRQQGVSPNKFTFIQVIKGMCCFTNT
jgi:pentatricopeptide repeat protein